MLKSALIAIRALEICNLAALNKPDTLRAKLAALSDLLKGGPDELAVDSTFAGSRHFIGQHPELRRHPWLIRLLAAIEERNAAAARAAVAVGQAASAPSAARSAGPSRRGYDALGGARRFAERHNGGRPMPFL